MRPGLCLLLVAALAAPLAAQPANPVYTDDSPAAADTLARAAQLLGSGNTSEAARALQRLLDDEGERVIADPADQDLFVSVRDRVHAALLASPPLAAEYRRLFAAPAEEALRAGHAERVEGAYLLTPSGFEAALRLAQLHLEAGHFEAARLALAQLEHHPDRRGPGAGDAAALLRLLARYLDRPEVWTAADRWSAEAGHGPPAREPFPRPPAAETPVYSPLLGGVEPPRTGVPSRPLWSQELSGDGVAPEAGVQGPLAPASPQRASAALWIYPSVVGDTLIVNDGVAVRGLDRYTLEPRWRAVPPAMPGLEEDAAETIRQQRAQRALHYTVEDASTVTVAGPIALSVTGLAERGERVGDPRLHAVDTATGRVLWSVLVSQTDPRLRFSSIRGPVAACDGVAVVSLRKAVPTQRVVTQYLVGLDLWTGALRWVRHVGSAGSLPYQRDRRMADTAALDRGVVYCADQLGVCGAFEARTGRPRWVRRTASIELGNTQSSMGMPWESNGPVVFDEGVAVLTADHRDVLLLAHDTGEIIARRSADAFGDPWYLVRAGAFLVAVGREQVASVPAAALADGAIRLGPRIEPGPIQGRVVPCGGMVAVPSPAGLTVFDPADPASPTRPASRLALERPGVALPLGDQVLTADDAAVHSYLTWEAADGLLGRRMAADPADPRPAVAAADLAFRAGRPDRIAPAADLALAAISRDPASPSNAAARSRLFDTLYEMLRADAGEPAPEAAPQGGPGNLPPPLPPGVQDELVSRLVRAASTPAQRVAGAFTLGRLRESQRRVGEAVDAYQAVLDDPALAETLWAGQTQTVRAHAEASRRLWDVVRREGARAYAAFEARAAREAAALGPVPPLAALESIARRFPAASVTPGLWLRAADVHEAAGATREAIGALYSALYSAEMLGAARPAPVPEFAEAGGRLLRTLERADRVAAAAQVLASLRARHPSLALTARGAPIDAAALAGELAARLAAVTRFPRIGSAIAGDPQAIEGWALMTPLSRTGAWLARDHVMLSSPARQQAGLWGQDGGPWDERSGPERLQLLWSRPYRGDPPRAPVLLRSDPDSVFLFWSTPEGATVERIDAVGGRTRWETGPFLRLFAPDPAFDQRLLGPDGRAVRFDTPLEGPTRATDMMVAFDDQTLALVERSGRAAFFNAQTGRLLHALFTPVGAVYDADAAGGRVVIGGVAQPPGPGGGVLGASPIAVCYDAATGAELRRFQPQAGEVRWVRLADADRVVLGSKFDAVCSSVSTGRPLWAMDARATSGSLDAWIFGERLFILNEDRQLFAGSIADGSVAEEPVGTRDHLESGSRIDAFRFGGRTAFASARGVVLVSDEGKVVGMDALPDEAGLLPPVPSERAFVALETVPREVEAGRPGFALHLLGAEDASLLSTHRLVLWDTPSAIATLDGRVVVTAGNVTTVYAMPADDPP